MNEPSQLTQDGQAPAEQTAVWWQRALNVAMQKLVHLRPPADPIQSMVFAQTPLAQKELAERVIGLRPRMRALLVLVNSERDGARLLRMSRELSHDAVSLLQLYHLGLIAPDQDDYLAKLDEAIRVVNETMPEDSTRRRVLSRIEYNKFLAASQTSLELTDSDKTAFDATDLSRLDADTLPLFDVEQMAYKKMNIHRLREEMEQQLSALQQAMRADIERQRAQARAADRQDDVLSQDAEAMLLFIADKFSLYETLFAYPRVLNRLAAHWDRPPAFVDEIDELLLDSRGGIEGFRFAILMELGALKDFFYENKVNTDKKAG